MSRKIRYVFFMILFIISINNISYCKYKFLFDETVIKLKRDSFPPKCEVKYSTQEWTNGNVMVTIEADKEIEQTSGFKLSDDKKKLTKMLYVNESDTVLVKDFSGNSTEVEYNVNNIDKEPPQIIGCENNKEYQEKVKLDFYDNVEISDISIDRFSEKLEIYSHSEFLNSYLYNNIDRTANSITVHIRNHPLNTKNYKYYINDRFYTISDEEDYTYTGLEKGTEYKVTVEALDRDGNILDKKNILSKTSFFEVITDIKTDKLFSASIINIDKSVKKVDYSINNFYDKNNIRWYEANINAGNCYISCENNIISLYQLYQINAYLYDENNNVLDVIQFLIDFNTNYNNDNLEKNNYEIEKNGYYQIKVRDVSENETTYYIKIK